MFLCLYKSFSEVLAEPLQDTDGSLHPSSVEADEMAIENEDTTAMELDKEGGKSEKRCVVLNFPRSYCVDMIWYFNLDFYSLLVSGALL